MAKRPGSEPAAAVLFLMPSLAGFLLFFLLPFIAGIYYSLVSSPINGSFVGLSNYAGLLGNPIFLKAASNTLIFTGISVPLNVLLSLGLAMLLNRRIYFKKLFRSIFISPLVIPVASVVLVWQLLFDMTGPVSLLLTGMGLGAADWMNSGWARGVIMVVYLWKNIGCNMVIFTAGLQNIPKEYYEAADIDGASPVHRFANVTLVYLIPTGFFILIISIINSFKVFRETYMMSGAYPHESIYMLQHYMNNMFASLDYQKLTSAAFMMAVLVMALVWVLFRFERRMGRFII